MQNRTILLPVIVERAKKCLDFTSTLYITHLVICSCYDGIPKNWEWWILQFVSMTLMVVLGEFASYILLCYDACNRDVHRHNVDSRNKSWHNRKRVMFQLGVGSRALPRPTSTIDSGAIRRHRKCLKRRVSIETKQPSLPGRLSPLPWRMVVLSTFASAGAMMCVRVFFLLRLGHSHIHLKMMLPVRFMIS